MFGGLIPDDDRKQQLRTIRTIQAIGAGLIQSLIALSLFFAGGFRLSATGFSLLLISVWAGHITFYLLIRKGINLLISTILNPSTTQWGITSAISF